MKKVIAIIAGLTFSVLSHGQSLFESALQNQASTASPGFALNGYVRGMAFGAGDEYDVTNAFGEVSLQANLKKDKFVMNSDLRFRSGYSFNKPIAEFELKEAYAGISTSGLDLYLGEQIISWGRTDGFNPTNNITPNNYFFFSPDPDDQKIPNFLMKANIRFSPQINWEIIAIPIFRPSMYRYELFDMGENVSFSDAVAPDKTLKNGALATKLNIELSGIGFSASWFSGFDPFYGFDLKNVDFSTGSPIITYIPSFYRKNTLGLDFALPINSWIIRGEGAWNSTKNDEQKIFIPHSDLSFVIALEHNFWGFTTLIQYIGKYTPDFEALTEPILADPMNPLAQYQYAIDLIDYESAMTNRKIFHQQEEMNHALSVTLTKDFAYETMNVELTGFYDFTSEEYIVRPKLTWKIGDGLTCSAGYNYMKGPEKSIFEYTAPVMNGAFIAFKANF